MSECINCGAPGAGNYCSRCGRPRGTSAPSLRELIRQSLEEIGGIESRLRRTLRALFLKPGRLTREYVQGRGALYVPPVKLLLMTAGVCFGLVSLGSGDALFLGPLVTQASEMEAFRSWGARVSVIFIIPLFPLVLSLLYHRSRATYGEHLLFSVYLHSFFFLAGAVGELLGLLSSLLEFEGLREHGFRVIQLVILIYLFLALRRARGEGFWRTLLKTLGAVLGYAVILAIALGSVLGLNALLEDLL